MAKTRGETVFIMKSPPASSRHLSAFGTDVYYHLEQTGLFSRITVKKTGLPECALVVVCSLANGSVTQAEVSATLERVWNEAPLGYNDGENVYKITVSTTVSTKKVQMEFATSTSGASVTGRIDVIGFN